MTNYELLNKIRIPETATMEYKEDAIDITQIPKLKTGSYVGRVGAIKRFTSKDGMNKYVKIPVGTRVKFENQEQIIEVERVFLADYRSDSLLVKLLDELGCIVEGKFIPEKLMNLPVRFVVKPNENAGTNSKYTEMVDDIELIDELPEHLDFKYYRVTDIDSVQYIAAMPNAEIEKVKSQKSIGVNNIDFSAFDDDDDNFLNFDSED